ncbi:MAG: transporter [Muribaculaceae bacterium]|nr:transporter [Muribaculaceae bacterium]
MTKSNFRTQIKPWILPIAMLFGMLFHNFMDKVEFMAPYLIFIMLFITFCRINPNELRVSNLSLSLISIQLFGALALFFAISPLSVDVAQGTFICIFCPTATAAPVITGMLGGSVPRLATFSLISNIMVAITAPFLFSLIGSTDMPIATSIATIAMKVMPLILVPLITALALRRIAPKVHAAVATRQSLSFYIWALSLFIVVGRAVSFVMNEPWEKVPEMIVIALCSLVACCLQFYYGRRIGRACGDKIAGAQGLGQKNTVLAIWMALTYLNPISSIGPAAYVAWQNTINSIQLYLHQKKEIKTY